MAFTSKLRLIFLCALGYVGDEEATAATVNSRGWLRTGDICYFDSEGFLFYVDRMKDLIKYKGYQVMFCHNTSHLCTWKCTRGVSIYYLQVHVFMTCILA